MKHGELKPLTEEQKEGIKKLKAVKKFGKTDYLPKQ
jgi:hypothetical protein